MGIHYTYRDIARKLFQAGVPEADIERRLDCKLTLYIIPQWMRDEREAKRRKLFAVKKPVKKPDEPQPDKYEPLTEYDETLIIKCLDHRDYLKDIGEYAEARKLTNTKLADKFTTSIKNITKIDKKRLNKS